MVDIIHRVGIKAPPKKVYAAVATVEGVAGWWTQDATGVSDVGGILTLRFQSPTGEEIGKFDIEVLELIPDKKVRWRVKSGPEEWVGTDHRVLSVAGGRLHGGAVWSPELARGRGVYGPLQYEVGNVHAQPQGAR